MTAASATTPAATVGATTVAPTATTGPFHVVGRSVPHHDFVEKVKGSLLYAADWHPPGMLHSRLLRSEMASARIVSIHVDDARSLPGVVAVMTADDVPNNQLIVRASGGLGELLVSMPVLAADRVRYVGEPIVAIAAETQQMADEAADRVVVEYEPLEAVFDPEAALLRGAPLVHPEGNKLVEWQIRRGDASAALRKADVVVAGEYRTQHVEHAYLEPEVGVGWIENEVVTIRSSTQVIEHASDLATILDLPASRVRVVAAPMGGGFGGKEDMTVEPFLALLTWRTRRPVRMIWDRQESIAASTKRHPFVMRYETGASRTGELLAQRIEIIGDAGAYPYLSARVLFAAAALACGPYRVPDVEVDARAAFTNNVPASAFRGFGAMQVTFAYESQMDRVAKELGVDPVELRRGNFLGDDDIIPTGEALSTTIAVEQTLDRVLARLGPRPRPSGPQRVTGRGLACNMQPYGRTIWFRDQSAAWLTMLPDGALVVRSGVTDLGAGQSASLAQLASEVLGVPVDEIAVHIGDTALTPPAGGTFATRQLYMSGNAVVEVARELRGRIAPVAASLLGCDVADVRFVDGRVTAGGPNAPGMGLAELMSECARRQVDTSVLGVWRAKAGTFDPARGRGDTFPDYTYGTHGVDLEIDTQTGEVEILRYVASHDVGRAINPSRVEGQIQGGAMQGLGYALAEEIAFDEGMIRSSLFADYLIPNASDFPDVEVDLVETGDGLGPFGARGIGEPPVGPVAPAIANAVTDAIGVRPTRLPITPERLVELMESDDDPRVRPRSGREPESRERADDS